MRQTEGAALRVTVALASWLLAPGAAWAAPNTFNTALPVAEGNFVWREQLVRRERSAEGASDREVSVTALASVLGYGITSELAVFAVVPWFLERELSVTTPAGRITRSTDGLGDLTLFARYTVFQRDAAGRTLRVAPIAGLKAPTGNDDDRDRLGRLPRPLQASTGGWDGFAGAVITYQTLDFQVDGQVQYRRNGQAEGFEPGDAARFDASLQYRFWPAELDRGTPGFAYALLESNLVHRERDERSGAGTDSGGTQWLLAPGLQYVTRRWIVEGTVQLPLARDPNGEALEDDYILRVGFRFQF